MAGAAIITYIISSDCISSFVFLLPNQEKQLRENSQSKNPPVKMTGDVSFCVQEFFKLFVPFTLGAFRKAFTCSN